MSITCHVAFIALTMSECEQHNEEGCLNANCRNLHLAVDSWIRLLPLGFFWWIASSGNSAVNNWSTGHIFMHADFRLKSSWMKVQCQLFPCDTIGPDLLFESVTAIIQKGLYTAAWRAQTNQNIKRNIVFTNYPSVCLFFNSHVATHLRQVHAQKERNRTTFAFHRLHDWIWLFGALEKGNSDPSETQIPCGMAHFIPPQVFLFGTHKLIPHTFKPS